jgi:hypothetical protein
MFVSLSVPGWWRRGKGEGLGCFRALTLVIWFVAARVGVMEAGRREFHQRHPSLAH